MEDERISAPSKILYLIGEEHDQKGKELWQLIKLKQIHKETPLGAISVEFDHNLFRQAFRNYSFPLNHPFQKILDFAKEQGIAALATDFIDRNRERQEKDLEEQLALDFNPALLSEYRSVHWDAIRFREEYTTLKIHEYMTQVSEPAVAHICGLSHIHGLRKRFERHGYEVKVLESRTPKVKNKPTISHSKDTIMQSTSDYLGCYVVDDDYPVGEASHAVAQAYKRAIRHYNSAEDGQFYIDDFPTPPLTFISIDGIDADNPKDAEVFGSMIKDRINEEYLPSLALPVLPTDNLESHNAFIETLVNDFTEITLYRR